MRKKTITITSIAAGTLILVLLLVRGIGIMGISKTPFTTDYSYSVNKGKEIEISVSKDVAVAETEGKILYVNPSSLNLILEDKTTGKRYSAISSDKKATEFEKSLMIVNFVGKDNVFSEWDSFTKARENESYSLTAIDNGVRIAMQLNEGASERFYEYLPQKMSPENYSLFKDGLDKAVEEGIIDEALKKKYLTTLTLVFKKSKQDEYYNCTYIGNPPMSACRQMIAMAQMVGYTTEMLLEDAKKYDFKVEFKEAPVFDIVLDVTLEGDELVVDVPASGIVSSNPYFTITNIELLPNFGLVTNSEVEEGYLFVPDGCGALIGMNGYNPKVPDYFRPVYNNDFYKDYLYTPEYTTELMMPVFGVIYRTGAMKPFSILGMIESGADYANIEAMLASSAEVSTGRVFNKVYASFDVSQYEWVPVFGEFSDNTSTYLSVMPQTKENFRVRYATFSEGADYFEMAEVYRNHLFGSKDGDVYNTSAKLYLEILGTLSTTQRIIGIPYNSRYSMTTYEELGEILTDLDAKNANVSYLGAFDGGKDNMLMNHGKLVSKNGSKKELEQLKELIDETGSTLYLGTDFMRIWDSTGNGFATGIHADEDYTKQPARVYGTNKAVGEAWNSKFSYLLLKPSYLVDTVRDFLKKTGEKDSNLYVAALTNQYYADYGNSSITPTDAQNAVNTALDALSENRKLALDSPRADKIKYGTVACDIPRDSSEYAVFSATIPFYQLVLNGMCEYTTVTANNTSMGYDYYLMQALETGSELKFTLSSKSVDVLRDTEYSYIYSAQYDLLKEDIKRTVEEYKKAMEIIEKTKIIDHRIVNDNVFLTVYENGTKIYTNYNGIGVQAEGMEIPANGYVICR